jgi:hypothetical protein
VAAEEQRLVFCGKQLEDEQLLTLAGVEELATLHVLGRLLGEHPCTACHGCRCAWLEACPRRVTERAAGSALDRMAALLTAARDARGATSSSQQVAPADAQPLAA